MRHTDAERVLGQVHLRKGWRLHSIPASDDLILVSIQGDVQDSRDYPKYDNKTRAITNFIVIPSRYDTETDLLWYILGKLIGMAIHEEREFLRYGPNWDAPFHPHHDDSDQLYKDRLGDAASILTSYAKG